MKKIILTGLFVSAILVFFISPFASQHPDGLEKAAEEKGFISKSEGKEVFTAPLPGYNIPYIKLKTLSTSMAGLFGTLLVFGTVYGLGYLLKKRKSKGMG